VNTRQKLVVQSAFIGSFLLSVFGILVVPAKARVRALPDPVGHETVADQSDLDKAAASPGALIETKVCGLSDTFPESVTQWCDLITAFAEKDKLPADLIAAIVWVESGGDPGAYSHSGAVGLMQVMPRNGRAADFQCVNGPCFANRPTIHELQDPAFNIAYGVRMLAGLVEKYGGIRDALKAYGPMDVGFSYADQVIRIWRAAG
jgi:hypothetical protein